MKILITGGSGFIGRNLVEGLQTDYKIFDPSHKELDVTDSNRVEEYIKNKKIDVIIHSAVKGGDRVLETTIRMFLSLIKNINKVDKIINLGSGADFGKTRDLIKVKESEFGQYIPQDNFGLAKYLCSIFLKQSKKIVNLRLFGVYGKYEDYRIKFISNSIIKNILGLPIKIKQNAIYDYLFMDDLIPIVKYLIENDVLYSDYNITPTESISLVKIADIINQLSRHRSKIDIKSKGYNFQYTADNSRLMKTIPKLTFTPYEFGIEKLYCYYSRRIKSLDTEAIIQDNYFRRIKIRKR